MRRPDGNVMQKWLTAMGPTTGTKVIQSSPAWEDLGFARLAVVRAEIRREVNCKLILQTSSVRDSAEGSGSHWTNVIEIAASPSSSTTYYLEAAQGATYKLERFVRWVVEATADDWEICFWIAPCAVEG